jgi:hypothetical protein
MTFITRYQRENILRESLEKFITLHKVKYSISLEVGLETKLFPDSALGNYLCTSGYKTKSEKKNSFFSWPPMPLEIELLPRG